MSYKDWIEEHVPTDTGGYGRCHEFARMMVEEFPELRRVEGYVETPLWGRRAHGWCVGPDKRIVDPTAAQFDAAGGISSYEEVGPQTFVCVGKCMTCAEYLWERADLATGRKDFCSAACRSAFLP